jgi:ABC-2 type transport system ATP-binding protein
LLADTDTKTFIAQHSAGRVRIRVSEPDRLTAALGARGVASEQVDGYLQVNGLSTDEIGRLARDQQVAVLELFEQKSSLEEAFIETTSSSVAYRAGTAETTPPQAPAGPDPDGRPEAVEQGAHGRKQGT